MVDRFCIYVIVFSTFPCLVMAQDTSTEATQTQPASSQCADLDQVVEMSKSTTKIGKLLSKRVSCDFKEETLESIIPKLGEEHDINFVFDTGALEAAGMDPETCKITLRLKDVPLRSVLSLMLRQDDLSYVVKDMHSVVMISTVEEAEATPLVKFYSVRDLLSSDDPNASADELIEVLTGTVVPESWEELGGPGNIRHYQGVLVVTQSGAVQDVFRHTLARLKCEVLAAGGPTFAVPKRRTSDKLSPVVVPQGVRLRN